jgi:hypothetical protein
VTATGGGPSGAGGSSTGGAAGAGNGSGGSGERDYGTEREDFFGSSRCAGADVLLCDGFEGASIDSALWTVQKSGSNIVELTDAHAARGAKSLHIHAVTGNTYGFLRNTTIFPVANNDYYGRMFVRVARYSTVMWAHWTLGEATA